MTWPWATNTPGYTYPQYQPDYNVQWQWWGTCPHCGGLYQWGNKFCPSCGKSLGVEAKPTLDTVIEKLDEIIRILSEKANKEVRE